MRQVFCRSYAVTFVTGDSGYVFSDKIDPGYVLHVHRCFGYAPERIASEDIVLGVRHGGDDVIMLAFKSLAAQKGAATETGFYIGEGDQVFGYFPNATSGEHIGIHLNGVLVPLDEWQDMPE